MLGKTIRCKFCNEKINAKAIKCRYCGEFQEISNKIDVENIRKTDSENTDNQSILKTPNTIISLACGNCNVTSEVNKWTVRQVLGIIYLLMSPLFGILLFLTTNPYICENCGKREFLTKNLRDGSHKTIASLSKQGFLTGWIFLPLFIVIVFSVYVLSIETESYDEGVSLDTNINTNSLQTNNTKDVMAVVQESINFYNVGEISEAIKVLTPLFEDDSYNLSDKDWFDLYNVLAKYKIEVGAENEVESAYNEALKYVKFGSIDYHNTKGEIALLNGNIQSAIEEFKNSLVVDSNDPSANNNLGLIYIDESNLGHKDLEKALEYNALYYELANDKQKELSKKNLALNYYLLDENKKAEELYNTLSQNDAHVLYYLGLINYERDDYDNFRQYYNKAIEIDSSFKDTEIDKILLDISDKTDYQSKGEYPYVVNIICESLEGEYSGGSGTVINETGRVLTNSHIFPQDEENLLIKNDFCIVFFPINESGVFDESSAYTGTPVVSLLHSDKYDIAFLDIGEPVSENPPYANTFPSYDCENSNPKLGERIRVIGYPNSAGGFNLTITEGIVSSINDDGFLTSAKVDKGNSGGTAIDENGCFLGIPTSVVSGDFENFGQIIGVNKILEFGSKALE